MAGGVICALEASADPTRVAAVAADIADQLGLRLVVASAGAADTPAPTEAFLEGIAATAGLHGAELRVNLGEPIDAVLGLAALEEGELIIAAAAGEVWRELVARADCPVLVIPEGAAQRIPARRVPQQILTNS